MANTIISSNMSLPIPVVGVDPGPDWALNIDASLEIIDGHNHTSGMGVQIPPSGLNINADLTFQGNNAVSLRSARFSAQNAVLSAITDIGCVYVVSADLYYNDISGNNIRITQNGSIAGTPGSIANLSPPASASYVSGSGTFVFQSDVNTAANIDGESLILRNSTASSKGLTLSPPAAMASDINITLPAIPGAQSVLEMDAAGNISTVPVSSLFYVPTGVAIPFTGGSIPSGYLICNGQAVSRTTYSTLFSLIGTTYGNGDGSTTFNVPIGAPLTFTGANAIPAYISTFWPLNSVSGGEPNDTSLGSTYDLSQVGSVPSGAGHITATSRGPFSTLNYFKWPAGGSSTTIFNSQTFFVDAWFNTSISGVNQTIIGNYSGVSGWVIFMNPSNQIESTVGATNITTSGTYDDGNWHYVALVFSTATNGYQLYVDNVLIGQTSLGGYSVITTDLSVGIRIDSDIFPWQGQLESLSFANSFPNYPTIVSLINSRWNGGAGSNYTTSVDINYIIKT